MHRPARSTHRIAHPRTSRSTQPLARLQPCASLIATFRFADMAAEPPPQQQYVLPPPLQPGDSAAIVAVSGPVDQLLLTRGVEILESWYGKGKERVGCESVIRY